PSISTPALHDALPIWSAECQRPRTLAAGCELEAGPWSGREFWAGEPQRSRIFRALFESFKTPEGVGQQTRVEAGAGRGPVESVRSEEHTSELQSRVDL